MSEHPEPPSKWDMIPPEEQQRAHAIIAMAPLLAPEELERYKDILEGESTDTLDERIAAWRERNGR